MATSWMWRRQRSASCSGAFRLCNGSLAAVGGIELIGIVGIAATTFFVAALAAALGVRLERPTSRIVVRVAGSWIAAIGLLLIGWTFRAAGTLPFSAAC